MNIALPHCVWSAGALLGEGPVWSPREQSLYWTDILGCALHRYTPASGDRRSWSFDENICAVAERRSGGLIVTLRSGFAYFNPDTSALARLLDPEPHLDGNRFNDGKCDAAGRFWAGTMDADATEPTGSLYRFDAGGRCETMDTGYAVSNGPAFSRDGRTMFHNDTHKGLIYAFDFNSGTGSLGNRRVFAEIAADQGKPDGMTVDRDGGLWVALFGGGQVVRLDEHGDIDARIPLPCLNVTSCCFGGEYCSTLFITTGRTGMTPAQRSAQPLAGGLFAVDIPGVAGDPPAMFAG